MERRIIAIQMLPTAYDEIQRLKGEETWTRFIIQCVLAKVGGNSILQDELASLEEKPKEPKAEKPKAPTKARKGKTEAAVETEVPSAEEAERVEGEGTLIMPHTHKSKAIEHQEPVDELPK